MIAYGENEMAIDSSRLLWRPTDPTSSSTYSGTTSRDDEALPVRVTQQSARSA